MLAAERLSLIDRGGVMPDAVELFGHDVRTATLILWATLAGAVVLTGQPTTWHVLRHVVTIVHEAGHALVAVMVGRRLTGIRLHSDTSGVTVSSGRPTGPGMVLTAAAGYPAPGVLGLGLAVLIAADLTTAMLWACIVLLVLMLVNIRNAFGALSVLATAAATGAVIWWATPWVSAVYGASICWLLLVGGVRATVELQRTRRRSRSRSSDADQLARLTGVGGLFWVLVFWVVGVGCLVSAGWLLLR
ncbi:M50 family metallopeptidase [Spongisporangium articulatum]|uniref:M50 family metallopeptidase n=1 Tax=Spongisporangium articulatum TaxID=3362603 RepID=A0ABW8AMJ1_9ACTN